MKATLALTRAELNYIYDLVLSNKKEGAYWGRKDYFTKRQGRVLSKIVDAQLIFRNQGGNN